MTIDQPSFVPVFLLAMLAGLFLSAWQGMIPGVPRWDVWCVFGTIAFGGTCAMGGRWVIHEVNFIANQSDILQAAIEEAKTRRVEAFGKMNDRQLTVCTFDMNVDLDMEMSGSDYVNIGGQAVLRDAIVEIDNNRQGMNLKAEHNATTNQAGIRHAMDVMAEQGAVDAGGHRNKPPRIIDERLYNEDVALAKAK